MSDDIKLPELPRLQVPRVDADVDLMDLRRLATWCEKVAKDHARAAVLADRERRAQPAPGEWRPIATAPHNGSFVLLRSPQGRIADGSYDTRYGVWAWPYVMVEPTHWQPLPILSSATVHRTARAAIDAAIAAQQQEVGDE